MRVMHFVTVSRSERRAAGRVPARTACFTDPVNRRRCTGPPATPRESARLTETHEYDRPGPLRQPPLPAGSWVRQTSLIQLPTGPGDPARPPGRSATPARAREQDLASGASGASRQRLAGCRPERPQPPAARSGLRAVPTATVFVGSDFPCLAKVP
jgi:hypothetical protein